MSGTMPGLAVLGILAIGLWSAGGHTSQVFYRQETLQDLVRDADVIVVAEPATPATVMTAVDITPPGQKPDVKRWPPWQRLTERWVVRELLLDGSRFGMKPDPASPVLRPGLTIDVDSAIASDDLWLHRAYYVDGMSESPIHSQYRPPGPTTNETTSTQARILILRRAGAAFTYAMLGASEFVEHRGAVEDALKLRRDQTVAVPTVTPAAARRTKPGP